ncbi:hypothetical protein IW261DRAFT_1589667 [Armillaria novae-zelandiae]|uniref:Uncharacterized protein n=1 Tax=Armillaria novae-zelandiae TaxID=153914 RepID=A0AA39UH60_9AGAR|nr:hypothetical protein IW261DRAFT_1589667 [Armillaria novae-zelandiae]
MQKVPHYMVSIKPLSEINEGNMDRVVGLYEGRNAIDAIFKTQLDAFFNTLPKSELAGETIGNRGSKVGLIIPGGVNNILFNIGSRRALVLSATRQVLQRLRQQWFLSDVGRTFLGNGALRLRSGSNSNAQFVAILLIKMCRSGSLLPSGPDIHGDCNEFFAFLISPIPAADSGQDVNIYGQGGRRGEGKRNEKAKRNQENARKQFVDCLACSELDMDVYGQGSHKKDITRMAYGVRHYAAVLFDLTGSELDVDVYSRRSH